MVTKIYTPKAGDLVWINFNPSKGHEQKNLRPALVLSPKGYNKKTGLALFCPITSKTKGYPFEVTVKTKHISGVVLADHVRSLDWQVRQATFITTAPGNVLQTVTDKLNALLNPTS